MFNEGLGLLFDKGCLTRGSKGLGSSAAAMDDA